MKSWNEFSLEEPELANLGKQMLFKAKAHTGLAFLATIRKDGAPRLHPICLVISHDRLYVFISPSSPKCADLKRDGRYALQAFPPTENEEGREFYLSGVANCIQDPSTCQVIKAETGIYVEEGEVLFELFLCQAMYTMLLDRGTSSERPWHRIWQTPAQRHA